jgi:lysophospholipase L1-like esterase
MRLSSRFGVLAVAMVVATGSCALPPAVALAAPAAPDPAAVYAANASLVHFSGRLELSDPAGPRFSWPATGLSARVRGRAIDIKLRDTAAKFATDDAGGADELEVWIDGQGPTVVTLSFGVGTYSLASELTPGEHDVQIFKRTEGQVGTIQYLGFVEPLVPTTHKATRKIEFIGDSITAGYGIDMWLDPSCKLAPTEDSYLAYSSVTARNFKADYFIEAWSGRGMYQNWDGSTDNPFPTFYGRTLADDPTTAWDFSLWTPDVVVVNLGSNDAFSLPNPGPPFVAAYEDFVGGLRRHYPRAFVILIVPGTMLWPQILDVERPLVARVVDFFRSRGDSRVSSLEFPIENEILNTAGCGDHPSIVTHQQMAAQLADKISALTGWSPQR